MDPFTICLRPKGLLTLFPPGKDTFYHRNNISRDKAREDVVKSYSRYSLVTTRFFDLFGCIQKLHQLKLH